MDAKKNKTITLEELQNMNCDTHDVKDDSPRGVKAVPMEWVKRGDKVVLDNHFITVI